MSANLYLVHCGFYDPELCQGVYENHINLFTVADSFDAAKAQIKNHPDYKRLHMHVDGVQKLEAIDGIRIECRTDPALAGKTLIESLRYKQTVPTKG